MKKDEKFKVLEALCATADRNDQDRASLDNVCERLGEKGSADCVARLRELIKVDLSLYADLASPNTAWVRQPAFADLKRHEDRMRWRRDAIFTLLGIVLGWLLSKL